jgi:putative RecB family exonuclease
MTTFGDAPARRDPDGPAPGDPAVAGEPTTGGPAAGDARAAAAVAVAPLVPAGRGASAGTPTARPADHGPAVPDQSAGQRPVSGDPRDRGRAGGPGQAGGSGGPGGVDGSGAGAAARPVFIGSLSPSRAADFVSCPLKYRFRVVDRLPEPPSQAATRGTMVHSVLERLFDLPAAGRTRAAAEELLAPVWAEMLAREPELAAMFADDEALTAWLTSGRELLAGYFALEDPTRLAPAARELYVEHVLESGLRLRGYVDRLDEARTPDGLALRVVDYKTGRSPGPAFEGAALFQMRFYALLLWRTRGVMPRELRLYYLGDRSTLWATPDEAQLRSTERRVEALWAAISRAHRTGDWRATPSRLCDWCDHKARCPAFGGTPPPLPPAVAPVPVDDAAPAVCEADG